MDDEIDDAATATNNKNMNDSNIRVLQQPNYFSFVASDTAGLTLSDLFEDSDMDEDEDDGFSLGSIDMMMSKGYSGSTVFSSRSVSRRYG